MYNVQYKLFYNPRAYMANWTWTFYIPHPPLVVRYLEDAQSHPTHPAHYFLPWDFGFATLEHKKER